MLQSGLHPELECVRDNSAHDKTFIVLIIGVIFACITSEIRRHASDHVTDTPPAIITKHVAAPSIINTAILFPHGRTVNILIQCSDCESCNLYF